MNVTCGSCPAKYAVPDDKVRGKKARIKCKHCGADILVDGTSLAASVRPADSHGGVPASTGTVGITTPPAELSASLVPSGLSKEPPPPAETARPVRRASPLPAPRATPLAKIQPKTIAVPVVADPPRTAPPSDTTATDSRAAFAAAPTPAAKNSATPDQDLARPKPAQPKPAPKMTMVGLAGPAPGSHSPESASKLPLPIGNAPEAAAKLKPQIGLAAARGGQGTLLGGTQAPKFEPPTLGARTSSTPPRSANVPTSQASLAQVWMVAFSDSTQREVSVAELKELKSAGLINDENLVWQEGMTDWLQIRTLPALLRALTGRSPSTPPPTSEPPTQTAPSPPQAHDGVWSEPGSWAQPPFNETQANAEPVLGLGEEISRALNTSVAESEMISSETPPTVAFQKAPPAPSPVPPKPKSGSPAKPESAKPSLPAHPVANGSVAAVSAVSAVMSEKRARRWPLVMVLLLGVVGGGAVAVVYTTKAPPAAFALLDQVLPEPVKQLLGGVPQPAVQPVATPAPTDARPAAAQPTVATDPAVPATAASAPTAPSADPTAPPVAASAIAVPSVPPSAPAQIPDAKAPRNEKQELPESSGTESTFDEARAKAVLARLALGVQKCRGAEPVGKGQVRVTFGPSGEANGASVVGQYAASDAGLCVIDVFRQAKVPSFHGEPSTVVQDFALQ